MASQGGILKSIGANAQVFCRRTWWVFLMGGLASVAFGVLAFLNPGLALYLLALYFAASILVDGAFNVAGALGHRGKDGWWVMLLMGLLGLGVGGFALLNPPVSIVAFIFLVAIQAILLGIFLLVLGYKVRRATSREWILYVTGHVSVLLGVFVFANPLAGGDLDRLRDRRLGGGGRRAQGRSSESGSRTCPAGRATSSRRWADGAAARPRTARAARSGDASGDTPPEQAPAEERALEPALIPCRSGRPRSRDGSRGVPVGSPHRPSSDSPG